MQRESMLYGSKLVLGSLLLLSFSQIGHAQEHVKWHVTIAAGQAEAQGNDQDLIAQLPSSASLISSDYSDSSLGFTVGYSVTDSLIAEIGYQDLGEGSASYSVESVNPETLFSELVGLQPILASGVTLGASYAFIENEQWSFSVNGGLFAWESDLESQSTTQVFRSSEDGSDLYFGLAAGLKLNEHWTLGVGYRSYQLDESISDLHATLSYRF